jgi:hypothetical protein
MTAVLGRLSADHVPLVAMILRKRGAGDIAVFADGTALVLRVRSGGAGMERLSQVSARRAVWLAEVQPCFGCRWFWIGFTAEGFRTAMTVLASVAPVPLGSPESSRG